MATDRPRIGFVGLGRMGLPMSRRLLAAGFPLVVHNRTPARAEPLLAAGATFAELDRLAAECDVICACLDSIAASEAIFAGPKGAIESARPGTILIDHSTISVDAARSLANLATRAQLTFLDAPVSGGPEGAEQGTLTIMAGGPADTFERARPVMQAYGRKVVRMGDIGAGTLTKLVNQLLTFVHGAAAAEAIGFAERAGLDLAQVGEVLSVSFGQSRMLERALGRWRAGNLEAGAALKLYRKDLGVLEQVGRETGARLPMIHAASALLDEAQARGLGDKDLTALGLLFSRT